MCVLSEFLLIHSVYAYPSGFESFGLKQVTPGALARNYWYTTSKTPKIQVEAIYNRELKN